MLGRHHIVQTPEQIVLPLIHQPVWLNRTKHIQQISFAEIRVIVWGLRTDPRIREKQGDILLTQMHSRQFQVTEPVRR